MLLYSLVCRFLSHQSVFGDDLPNRIMTGKVMVKANVKEFTSTSAISGDGTQETVDTVVFAQASPPLSLSWMTTLKSWREHTMFKFVLPPQLEKPTLAFMGMVQPVGATVPTAELQSRWAAHVFTDMMVFTGATVLLIIHSDNKGI